MKRATFPPFFCLLSCCSLSVVAEDQPAAPPGVVINHSPAASRQYIGSPSLAVLPNGEYVTSHDYFGPGSTRDTTLIFASADRGETWKQRATIKGQWWSTLFVHRDLLYILGTSQEYGFTVIRRSTDGGATWTEPKDETTGLLLGDGKYHCAPVPILRHKGRLWRAMEDAQGPGGWGHHFRAFMMSVPEEADLLDARQWTFSNRLGRDPQWLNSTFKGWLEGNAVLTPAGEIVDILRVDAPAFPETAAIVHISADGTTAKFDPGHDFITFPGGAKKFTIRFDPVSKLYWSLANYVPPSQQTAHPAKTRNTLALIVSADLRTWQVRDILLQHPDIEKHGFQYVDWLFEGNDIIAACRTAFDEPGGQAHNQHDANYLTFHRFENFRTRGAPANRPTGASQIRGRALGSEIVITTTPRLAGAIHSLTWNGQEFIDSVDHGRQLQSASNFDAGGPLTAETYNPTEAGSRRDGAGSTSSSRLLHLVTSSNQLETTSQMAFWLAPGEKSGDHWAKNTSVLSNHLLTKCVQIGYRDLPHVIPYDVTFTLPVGEFHRHGVFEAVTGYMPPEFSQFWKFLPATGALEPLSDEMGEQQYPVILATPTGSHAMGIYSPDQPSPGFESVGYGRFRFVPEKVVKWNCVFRVSREAGLEPGDYRYRMFVIVGDLESVKSAIGTLHGLRDQLKK